MSIARNKSVRLKFVYDFKYSQRVNKLHILEFILNFAIHKNVAIITGDIVDSTRCTQTD